MAATVEILTPDADEEGCPKMASRKLDGYKGSLDYSQLAAGMSAARVNAHRLAKDARLLLEAKSYASAASLAALSIEEGGKVPILRTMALDLDEKALKAEWKRYRSHTSKNAHWIFPDLVKEGARSLEDFRSLHDESSDHPFVLDQVKQLGFYTDCLGDKANWSIPDAVIDSDLATPLVVTAELLSRGAPVTERELELWGQHLGPVWGKDINGVKTALVTWYSAMQDEGLIDEGPNKMAAFILGRLGPPVKVS